MSFWASRLEDDRMQLFSGPSQTDVWTAQATIDGPETVRWVADFRPLVICLGTGIMLNVATVRGMELLHAECPASHYHEFTQLLKFETERMYPSVVLQWDKEVPNRISKELYNLPKSALVPLDYLIFQPVPDNVVYFFSDQIPELLSPQHDMSYRND